MDKVKKDLNMFDGIEYVKDETDNWEVIIGLLSEIKKSLEEIR
jgi:hypothetical protein